MFGPSPLDGEGTMASADFCRFNLVSQPGLPLRGLATDLPR